jgi:hypothetical protein
MLIFLKIILITFILYVLFEAIIIIFFPKILYKNEFNDDNLCVKDDTIGWRQKSNSTLYYYHRYTLGKKTKIKLNNLGVLDDKNYTSKNNKTKIIIFGDTYFAGLDFGYSYSIQKFLNEEFKDKDVELIFCFMKNYSTIHFYRFYMKFMKRFKPKYIIYIFNSNHPRRNITIHESLKNTIFTQRPFNFKSLKFLKSKIKPYHKNDLIYLDENNKIIHKEYSERFFFRKFLYDNFFIFSKIDDFIVKGNKLREFNYISDIRKIEKKYAVNLNNYPYHWKTFENILLKWRKEAKKNKAKFIICRNLVSYHYSKKFNNYKQGREHDVGFKLSELPEIKYLKHICNTNKIKLYNFEIKFPKKELFLHERYGYYNKDGILFYSKMLIKILKKYIN